MGFIFEDASAELPSSFDGGLIPLDTAVLQARSEAAYHLATEHSAEFTSWVSSIALVGRSQLLIYSSLHALVSPDSKPNRDSIAFFVLATEPVQQGCVEEGFTKIVILPWIPPTLQDSSPHTDIACNDATTEEFEIDESFLSGTMLSPSANRYASSLGGWRCSLSTAVGHINSDECSVAVAPKYLSRIGVLNGDWALIGALGQRDQRLVRIQAAESYESPQCTVYVTPSLAYNITKSTMRCANESLVLKPTPFGSNLPRVPTARTITVARIASPISTDRSYQDIFLRSLHSYFLRRRRLVKQDDVITLRINTDDTRRVWTRDDFDENSSGGRDLSDMDILPYRIDSSNEVVFFKITNVEYDVLADESSDGFFGSTLGEWGCWVDSAVTRIIQTGLEKSRTPRSQHGYKLCPASSASKKFNSLVSAALTTGAEGYNLQLSILISGARGIGKMFTVMAVAERLGLNVLEVNCYHLIGENDTQTEGTLRARFEKAASCAPCILVLRHIDALSQSTQPTEAGKSYTFANIIVECTGELQQAWKLSGYPTLLTATTDYPDQMSSEMTSCFKHQVEFNAPDESERDSVLKSLLPSANLAPDVSFHELAVQTAALIPSDLADLAMRGERAYLSRAAEQTAYDAYRLYRAGANINANDLDTALNKARISYAESIGAPKIPNVTWDDVGGLASVKVDILDTIQLPLEHPELFADGMKKRSGILLYGPPGTGKTLLAKAVATSCALNFFSVKGPELLNMYIGESEANVRKVFQRARDAKPCVIFFDELDSVAPKRGNHGDSGGVMDRIVSQLLAELDGIAGGDAGADVFVIGATNRPDLLDSALLRPGRFDRMLYLGVSQTHEAQLNILQALTRKFKLHPDLSLQQVAEACPFHYTGADFYALCSDALLKAMSRKAEELDEKIAVLNAGPMDPKHPYPLTPQYYLAEMATPAEIEVLVTQEDFDSALRSLIPSVSQTEMEHYARVQQQFSKETINSL